METSIHTGHRKRTKEEFLTRGIAGLADHRVLELLLFYAIPQGDVNPLAHRLIQTFGSLAGVFNATADQLRAVKGVGENTVALIRLMPALAARYLEESAAPGDIITSSWQLKETLLPMFFGARSEKLCLLCLDGKHKVLACRELGEGIHDTVSITSRKIMEAALSCNAAKVVLAHNHVSGVALPSPADICTSHQLWQLLSQVGIELLDHVIFAGDEMVSVRDSGIQLGKAPYEQD